MDGSPQIAVHSLDQYSCHKRISNGVGRRDPMAQSTDATGNRIACTKCGVISALGTKFCSSCGTAISRPDTSTRQGEGLLVAPISPSNVTKQSTDDESTQTKKMTLKDSFYTLVFSAVLLLILGIWFPTTSLIIMFLLVLIAIAAVDRWHQKTAIGLFGVLVLALMWSLAMQRSSEESSGITNQRKKSPLATAPGTTVKNSQAQGRASIPLAERKKNLEEKLRGLAKLVQARQWSKANGQIRKIGAELDVAQGKNIDTDLLEVLDALPNTLEAWPQSSMGELHELRKRFTILEQKTYAADIVSLLHKVRRLINKRAWDEADEVLQQAEMSLSDIKTNNHYHSLNGQASELRSRIDSYIEKKESVAVRADLKHLIQAGREMEHLRRRSANDLVSAEQCGDRMRALLPAANAMLARARSIPGDHLDLEIASATINLCVVCSDGAMEQCRETEKALRILRK